MDIHRCRFVSYQPQAINALAFSHSSNPKQATPADLKLALARADGDIEIWSPSRGNWTQERIFRSGVERTAEQLHWTQDLLLPDEDEESQKPERGNLRLFSSGGSTTITEWDLERGVVKRDVEGNSADIWCFAPQPQWATANAQQKSTDVRAAPSQLIAAGCADGSIVLFSTADDDLRFDRVLTKQISKKSRCISLTWRDRNTLVAGFEENVIRVFDVRNRSMIRQMTLGKSKEGTQVIVWAVKCLPNGTILSGDSSGELKIWDSENFSLVQRLKTHVADVLDITTDHAGTMIFTCGVDRRIVAYAPIANQPSQKTQRWHETRHRRFHEHDVKAITSIESKQLSIAVAGGIDTVPVVLPLKNWNEEYHRSLPHLPQRPQMSVSVTARLMLTWSARDLLIWLLPQRYQELADSDSISDDQMGYRLLARIQLKNGEHITSAQISSSGNLIVVATIAGTKLFQIRRATLETSLPEVRSRPVELPKPMSSQGATTVGFSPDSKWLYAVRLNNVVTMAKITHASSTKERPQVHSRIVKLDRRKRSSTSKPSALGQYSRYITAVTFSSDSRILAVGDLSGAIDTWILEGHEATLANPSRIFTNGRTSPSSSSQSGSEDSESDSEDETDSRVIEGQKWIRTPAGSQLPALENPIIALAFRPSSVAPISPSNIHGNEGLHATRHNHHPVSPEHPSQEAGFLFAVTSSHDIVEFDTTNCKLSDWSRRNPSRLLPEKFRQIKDRVMGIWFDVRPQLDISRLWLYGVNFIYMLNLTRDFDTPGQTQSAQDLVKVGQLGQHTLQVEPSHALLRNSSRDGQIPKKRKRKNDGAGDEMRPTEKYNVKVRRMRADEAIDAGLLSPPGSVSPREQDVDRMDIDEVDSDDDDDDADAEIGNLVLRRRADKITTAEAEANMQDTTEKEKDKQPASWCTFQYRGIYGICALHSESPSGSEGGKNGSIGDVVPPPPPPPPEIVIVERPMFDVELEPRFQGGQDW